MTTLGSLQTGVNGLGRLALRVTPPSTPAPTTAPAAPAPAPVAVRPATTRRPIVGVGGAAGAQFSLINQDRAANGVATLA